MVCSALFPNEKSVYEECNEMKIKDSLSILASEARTSLRDPMMLLLLIVPFFFVAIVRFALPLVENILNMPGIFLNHQQLILSLLLVISPLLFGSVSGLSILDDRDEGLITVISITPVGRTGYLFHKLIIPLIVGWIGTLIVIPAAGFTALILRVPLKFILLTVLSGFEAVLLGLFMAALADNKVQGLVFMKGLGILFFPGVLVYFFPSPFFYLAFPIPMFWIMKMGYLLGNPDMAVEFWLHLIAGTAVHLGWIAFFVKQYLRKI